MKITHMIGWRGILIAGIYTIIVFAGCTHKSIPAETIKEDIELTRKEIVSYQYALTEGMKKKITGNLREAMPYFSECIRIKPQSDAALYELSSILTMAGNYREAIKYLKQAYTIDPQNIWYQLQLANLYHAIGNKDSTIIMYEEIHKNFPDRTDLYFDLATLHGEFGDEKRALKIFEELENYYGTNETILLAKQQLWAKSGKFDEAIGELLKLIEAYPNEVRFYGILAEVYSTANMHEKAREAYAKLFEIDPENGMGQLSIIEFYKRMNESNNLFEFVNKLINNETVDVNQKIQVIIPFFTNEEFFREHEKQINGSLNKLVNEYPKDLRVRTLKADYHVKVEDFQEAEIELRYVTDREKTNYIIWEQLLFVENTLGEYEKLYEKSKEAIELFPGAPNMYLLQGVAAMEIEKNKEAISSLQRGIGLVEENIPLEVQFYSMLGEAYRNDKNNEMSDAMFQKALNLDGENLFVLNNYSYYLSLREENLNTALEMSERCIKKEPENSTYLDTYAWILFKMENHNKAREYIEKAIKNNTNNSSEIIEHYGDILMVFDDVEEALKQWKKAQKLGKTNQELEEKIEHAEKKLKLKK